MEQESQAEKQRTISYRHGTGEVLLAENLDIARGMCPVLGKMSLEEAGLLLELESMGKEQLGEQPETVTKKPVIEKIEKVLAGHNDNQNFAQQKPKSAAREVVPEVELLTATTLEPTVTEITHSDSRKVARADIDTLLAQSAETESSIKPANPAHEDAVELPFAKAEPSQIALPITNIQDRRDQLAAQTAEMEQRGAAQITYEEPAAADRASAVSLGEARPPEEFIDSYVATENTAAEVPPQPENSTLPSADEVLPTAETFEPTEIATTIDTAELFAPEMPGPENQESDPDVPLTTTAESIIEATEQNDFETSDEDMSADSIAVTQPAEGEPTRLFRIESLLVDEVAELPAPVANIETTMDQLVAKLEEATAKATKITVTLEKIIALPATLEVAAEELGKEIEENLQELFTEIFAEANIDFSAGLIESFVKLTKTYYLEQLHEVSLDTETETTDMPQDIGTREFLQKLQRGLGAPKQPAMNFYKIGKSIMRLYSFSYRSLNLAPKG